MWKTASRIASPGGALGSLTVLFFHRVAAEQDAQAPQEPHAAWFDSALGWLQSQFTLLPLDEAVALLRQGRLPPTAAAITFDDGYRDNVEVAAPILLRRGVPATFFVATAFLDGGIMFNDALAEAVQHAPGAQLDLSALGWPAVALASAAQRRHAFDALLTKIKYLPPGERERAVDAVVAASGVRLPSALMMSTAQVAQLAAWGFGIGAHTHSHPILSRLENAAAAADIACGRRRLESIVGQRIGLFAYPNGRVGVDFDARHVAMVREAGFDAAFTTEPGVATGRADRHALPRFTPWRRDERGFRLRLLRNQFQRRPHHEPALDAVTG